MGVIDDFSGTYVYHRFAAGTFADGRYTKGAEILGPADAPLTMEASIQPATGYQRSLLPEGDRDKAAVAIFTETLLQIVKQKAKTEGDLVDYQGRQWLVTVVRPFDEVTDEPHVEAIAVAVEQD